MGTISDKLMRIINTKEDIRQALISKGYDVPTSIPFKEYAKMILDLPCNADSFPDIEGIVARYSASGLTNEEMSKNPVWKDLMGNGHDLQMKNFGWGGMSGVGGYVQNFNDFRNNSIVDKVRIDEQNSNSIKVTILNTEINNAIYIPKDIYQFNKSYSIKISSEGYNEGDLFLLFYVPSTSTATTVKVPLNPNGITEIPAIKEDDFLAVYINVSGKVGSFTIEQLPLYPGALVFDGVDDYGTCDNFPVMTKEKGYTVVVLRQWISTPTRYTALVSKLNISTDGSFVFEEYNNGWLCGSFGKYTEAITVNNNNPISWQTSKSYNGESINVGTSNDTDVLSLGKLYHSNNQGGFANIALYSLVILDHDATEEELTKIKDYFIKTYPWLFPDQAWTVVGKTNEDEDRATIANITGNGNDLVLSNFGFAEGSGYGSYVYNFNSFTFGDWEIIASDIKSNSFKVTGTGIGTNRRICSQTGGSSVANWHIKVSGMKSGDIMYIGNANKGGDFLTIEKDGQYHFEKTFNEVSPNGIWYQTSNETNILIEQIPEYEGYLITDGVDDKVQSSSFTMNEDWTIVGDWELLSNVQINCGIVKAQNVYLYNTANGLLISINNPRGLQSFGTKSLHAICSDGRLYDRNWVEYEYTVDQNFEIVESSLNIGFNLNNYTQIAFKNLGIYNNQILSKDDCIKAYNYLQTLKSK